MPPTLQCGKIIAIFLAPGMPSLSFMPTPLVPEIISPDVEGFAVLGET